MAFTNQNTWFHAAREDRQDEFHRAYEAAFEGAVKELGGQHRNFIGGQDTASQGGHFDKTAPWDTRVVVGSFPDSSPSDVDNAIRSARRTLPSWRARSFDERADILDRTADVMVRRFFDLCAAITIENGKNRFEAAADLDEAIDFCRHYAERARQARGYITPMGSAFPGEHCESRLVPYGVFAVIAPFNFPIAITMGMTAAAVVTGNAVVLKPTVDAPWCGEHVAKVLHEAGLPDGVLNLVQGRGSVVGEALRESSDVDGFVFTGSKSVGMRLLREAQGERPRPVIAEMGGKNPILVSAHADLDIAAEGVFNASFGYSGQKCSACSRIYVQSNVKDAFMNRFMMRVTNTIVGHPAERDTFMGPLINESALSTYQDAVAKASKDGDVLFGGERLRGPGLERGWFVAPTVVDGLPSTHELFRQELFVPLVVVDTFETFDEGIAKANDVEFGLTAGAFTNDPEEQQRFFDGIQAGVTYVNRRRGGCTGAMVDAQSFVGWKCSGTSGRGAGGRHYLQQFLREQSRTLVRE